MTKRRDVYPNIRARKRIRGVIILVPILLGDFGDTCPFHEDRRTLIRGM